METPHRIYLMRHGETVWNKEQRYQGSSDVLLSEKGEAQAERLALRLSKIAPTRALTSPLIRAKRTAEIVMRANISSVPLDEREELREYSFGAWEGMTIDEIKRSDGEMLRRWWSAPFTVRPDGAEDPAAIKARTRKIAEELRDTGRDGEISFVFAHGVIVRAVIAALLGIDDLATLWRMRADNCSVTIVELWGRRPLLLTLNDTTHMRVDEGIIPALNFHD